MDFMTKTLKRPARIAALGRIMDLPVRERLLYFFTTGDTISV